MEHPWQQASTSYAAQQWGASEVWPPDAQATGAAPAPSNPSAYPAGYHAAMGQGYAQAPMYPGQHQHLFHQQHMHMYGQPVAYYHPQQPHPGAAWVSHQPSAATPLMRQHHQHQHPHHPHWQYQSQPVPSLPHQHQQQHSFLHPISQQHVTFSTAPPNHAPDSASAPTTHPSSRPPQRASVGSSPQPPAPQKQPSSTAVDAARVFRKPGRLARPARFVVVLRGLPGELFVPLCDGYQVASDRQCH